MKCSLCGNEAIARFRLSHGCVARPEDRVQDLCLHHAMRSSPHGTLELAEDYSQGGAFSQWLEQRQTRR